jgi:hypothetical protein
MRSTTEPWDVRFLLLSPKEERAKWLEVLESYPHGMAVNCSHMPSLERTPILRKLIEDGHVLRVREYRGRRCSRTVLKLPEGI